MFGLGPVEMILIAAVVVVSGIVIGAMVAGIALIVRNTRRPPED